MTALRSSILLSCSLACLLPLACVDQGGDRAWGLAERRQFVQTTTSGPERDTKAGEFSVFVPLGLDRDRVVLSARESLTLMPGAKLLRGARSAVVASRGRLLLQERVEVGPVYGGAGLTKIAVSAAVGGYVKTCGGLELGNAALRDLALTGAGCEADEFVWRSAVERAGGASWTARDPDRPLALAPGGYATLSVEADSVLRLRSGTYYLDALSVARGGTLELDNLAGPIYVWVRQSLVIDGALHDYSLHPSILFGYAGTAALRPGSELRGTWIAPAADLTLGATVRPHSGAYFAKSITVAENALVEHRPFVPTAPPQAPPAAALCAECAAAAARGAAQCCEARRAATTERFDAALRCADACGSVTADGAPLCLAECSERSAPAAQRAAAWFDACMQSVVYVHTQCQLQNGYRPDSCQLLGSPRPIPTCGD